MTGRQPNPRDVRRLQTLEADLKKQSEATEKLAVERNELTARVKDLEATLKTTKDAQADDAKALEALLRQVEKLFKSRSIPPPAERTLAAFFEAIAAFVDSLNARVERAEKQVAALEEQLAAANEVIQEATVKFRELKAQADAREAEQEAQVASLTAELTKALKTLEDLEKTGTAIEPLLAENQRLADLLEAAEKEGKALRDVAASAKQDIAAARAETEKAVRAELGAELKKLTSQQAALQKQLETANAQLKQQGKTPILPAEQVAGLVNELVSQFQTNFTGLQIRDGELSLKVGFGAAGEVGGFVIPTTDSTPELRENLQEIKLRFERGTLEG
ncbi:MAG: hypothetical protein U0452_08455 [Anaerolineae bacterium]